ncbi:MAG TPA: PhnA-like protein [Bauldia sp.]|nr:PhnA-like protein [Bauldia sp.]
MSMPPEVNVAVVEESTDVERPVSWRAVLAGVVVALVVQILLAVLGGAIGLAFVDPTRTDNPDAGTVTVVAIIWWTLSGVLAAWVGGVTAGRLSGRPGTSTAAWHGLVAWAATTLVIFYLLTTAVGALVGGAFGVLGSTVGAAAGTATTLAPAVADAVDPFSAVETNIDDAIGVNDPEAARTAIGALVRAAFTAEGDAAGPAMDRAAAALARATRTSPEEARAQLETWKADFDQTVATAEAEAREAADAARKAASAAGIVSVIALVFGALAGWFGGWNSPIPDRETPFGRFGRRVVATSR